MVETVIFDIGNVLVPFHVDHVWERFSRHCDVPAGDMERMIYGDSKGQEFDQGLGRKYNLGEITSGQFYRQVCELLDMDITYSQFVGYWGDIFSPQGDLEKDNVREIVGMLETLRSKNIRLVGLSNGNEIMHKNIRRTHNVLPLLEDVVVSFVVGMMKPDEAIYKEALARADCKPGETVYIDDIAGYLGPARDIGMHTLNFDITKSPVAELRDSLGQLGLDV